MFSPEALAVLQARYLRPDESPDDMFWRVANHVAQAEIQYGNDAQTAAQEYWQMMSSLEFLPNTPALINAGNPRAQLAACYVLPIEDSLASIFETLKDAAIIHQSGGGTGFSFSRLRPRHSAVGSTGGKASGPVSFLEIYDKATQVVGQGAVRQGANMAVLRIDHPDIEEFITAKRQPEVLKNFNLSVAITDKFMRAMHDDRLFELVNPKDKQDSQLVKARKLFALLVRSAWENGEPGLFMLDNVNRANPTPRLGEIEAPNPCGEQPLFPYEACVLGSINVSKMVQVQDKVRFFDFEKLTALVGKAVRFLDNIIDLNGYPLPKVALATQRTRKMGLGIMGLADVFILLDIPYASEAATELTSQIMKLITKEARLCSSELGKQRGSFPAFPHSTLAKEGWPAMRNATVTTIAPTGSISIIAGCSSGIEPLFGLTVTRKVLDGQTMTSFNQVVYDYLSERNLLTEKIQAMIMAEGRIGQSELPDKVKKVLAIAHEISPYWHVAQLAAAQRYTNNGVSKTVNMPRDATEDDVAQIFIQAYISGCKGITVYRDGCRQGQVLVGGRKKCPGCQHIN